MKRYWPYLLTSTLFLSACNHDNPLKNHSVKQSTLFLMNASANAEKRLQFAIKEGDRGHGYLECMEGKKTSEINCEALFNSMIVFAKEGHYKGFEKIKLAELKDQKTFELLADEYAEILVSTWPKYYPVG